MDAKGRMWKIPVKREKDTYKLHDGYVKNFEKGLFLKKGYEYLDKKNLDKS